MVGEGGGFQMGSMYWALSLKGTLVQDTAAAEAQINRLDGTVAKSTGTFTAFEGVTKRNAREIKLMGAGVASVGGGLLMAGMAAQGAGEQFEGVATALNIIGGSMMAVGMISSTVFPMLRAMAISQNSAIVTSAKNFLLMASAENVATGATLTLATAMRALIAATVIGAVIVGLYLLYDAFTATKRAAKDLENQIDNLSEEVDVLKAKQTAYNEQLKKSETTYDTLKDRLQDYKDKIDNTRQSLERLKDIEEERSDSVLDLAEAQLDLNDAKVEYEMDPFDQRKAIAYARALDRVGDIKKKLNDLDTEKADLGDEETLQKNLTDYEKQRETTSKQMVEAEARILRMKEQEAAVQETILTKEFQANLLKWKKEGIPITEEDRQLFAQIPYMAKAMAQMEPTTKTGYMEFWQKATVTGPAPEYGKEVPSPYYYPPQQPNTGTFPDLAPLIGEVNITVSTPEDAARTVRDLAKYTPDSRLADRLAQKGTI